MMKKFKAKQFKNNCNWLMLRFNMKKGRNPRVTALKPVQKKLFIA